MHGKKAYSVTQINKYIKAILDEDYILSGITISGEISNCSYHSYGHIFFTLKDEESSISCVMFAANANGVIIENGVSAAVTGNVSVYVKTGQYQLYAKEIFVNGGGSLYYKFERLKKQLFSEGLFDDVYKKPLPLEPKTIAVVTSPTGAAVKDIISVAGRRNKLVKLAIFPVLVQGELAAANIAEAIFDINKQYKADIIIVARGGGSLEDLWAFNEEIVARAIFASNIPVISAVGHQTDFTISDFVADVRAATPSVAAEIAVPLLVDSFEAAKAAWFKINASFNSIILKGSEQTELIAHSCLKSMQNNVQKKQSLIYNNYSKIDRLFYNILDKKQIELYNTINLVEALSPLSVLNRGYSILYKDGALIKSVKDVSRGDRLTTKIIDGEIISEVIDKTD